MTSVESNILEPAFPLPRRPLQLIAPDLYLSADNRVLSTADGQPLVELPAGTHRHQATALLEATVGRRMARLNRKAQENQEDSETRQQEALQAGLDDLKALLNSGQAAARLALLGRLKSAIKRMHNDLMHTDQGREMRDLARESHTLQEWRRAATTPAEKASATRSERQYAARLEAAGLTGENIVRLIARLNLAAVVVNTPQQWVERTERAQEQSRRERISTGRERLSAWFSTEAGVRFKAERLQAKRSLETLTHEHHWEHHPDLRLAALARAHEKVNREKIARRWFLRGTFVDARMDSHTSRYNKRAHHGISSVFYGIDSPGKRELNRERLRLRSLGIPTPDAAETRRHTRPDRLASARATFQSWNYTRNFRLNLSPEAEARRHAGWLTSKRVCGLWYAVEKAYTFRGKDVRARHLTAVLEQAAGDPLIGARLDLYLRYVNTRLEQAGHAPLPTARPRWQAPEPAKVETKHMAPTLSEPILPELPHREDRQPRLF